MEELEKSGIIVVYIFYSPPNNNCNYFYYLLDSQGVILTKNFNFKPLGTCNVDQSVLISNYVGGWDFFFLEKKNKNLEDNNVKQIITDRDYKINENIFPNEFYNISIKTLNGG
jgi:hypothetical protein